MEKIILVFEFKKFSLSITSIILKEFANLFELNQFRFFDIAKILIILFLLLYLLLNLLFSLAIFINNN